MNDKEKEFIERVKCGILCCEDIPIEIEQKEKDKVHSRREWYQIGYKDAAKDMQEENGQLRLENNDLEAENDKLKEELKQASELKTKTIKLAKQETAREIISKMKKYRFHKGLLTIEYEMLVNDLAKQYGVEVE